MRSSRIGTAVSTLASWMTISTWPWSSTDPSRCVNLCTSPTVSFLIEMKLRREASLFSFQAAFSGSGQHQYHHSEEELGWVCQRIHGVSPSVIFSNQYVGLEGASYLANAADQLRLVDFSCSSFADWVRNLEYEKKSRL